MTIDQTTLCYCRHIMNSHPGEGACTTTGCTCPRFSPASRRSSSHYQRGQRTVSRRAACVQVGDLLLVGHPGYEELLRTADGALIWEHIPGQVTSRPSARRVQDWVLRPVASKTGALVAAVTGREVIPLDTAHPGPTLYRLSTTLGELPPLPSAFSVIVVLR